MNRRFQIEHFRPGCPQLMPAEGETRCRPLLQSAVACGFIFTSSDATTSTEDRRFTAEESNVATEDSVQANQNATAISLSGKYAQIREAGSVGRDQNIEGGISITTSDPATLQKALETYGQLASETAAVLKESSAEAQFLAGQAITELGAAKAAELTDGAAVWRMAVIVLGLAAAGVMAIKFWKR